MTYRVPIGLQRGLNVGCFIYLCELSQIKMPLRVIKHGSVPCRPSSCSVKSSNYFHLLPKLFFNSTSPRFRCNSNGPPITSAGVSDIAGNPALLRVKLAQPWLACFLKWATHGSSPGHHATGLLLETWTLGNVGINSRSLYDFSACSCSCMKKKKI